MPIIRINNPATGRGGSRNAGRKMPSNTSGMAAFGFNPEGSTVYATAAIGNARRARSINAHGAREALRQLIELRAAARLPVPSVHTAVRAFNRWLAERGPFSYLE